MMSIEAKPFVNNGVLNDKTPKFLCKWSNAPSASTDYQTQFIYLKNCSYPPTHPPTHYQVQRVISSPECCERLNSDMRVRLSGRSHKVHTGVALLYSPQLSTGVLTKRFSTALFDTLLHVMNTQLRSRLEKWKVWGLCACVELAV